LKFLKQNNYKKNDKKIITFNIAKLLNKVQHNEGKMTSISDIIDKKQNRILFDSEDIQIVKKEKKIDLSNHKIGQDELHVSQNDMRQMLQDSKEEEPEEEPEHKVLNNIDLDDVENNKVFLFVGDSNPTTSELKTLSLYSPILVYSSDLFTNRDIRALRERGIKSVWVANRSREANQWIQKNARLFRDEIVLLACYTKRKTQRWLKEIEPDVIIKRSNIKKLAVLSVSELLEALSSQGHLSLAPGWLERCAPWIYSRHLEPKQKN